MSISTALFRLLPVRGQNLAVSAYGLYWKRRRLGGRFAEYVEEFRRREGFSKHDLDRHINDELRRLLLLAFDEVPYYRRVWAGAYPIEDMVESSETRQGLTTLPVTPKDALRRDPWDLVARSHRRSPGLRRYGSSGSTGTPVTAIWNADIHRRFIAGREARSFAWAGTSIRKSRAMIGGRLVVPRVTDSPPFHRYNSVEKQVYLSAFHIAPTTARYYAEALDHYRPKVFTGYAHSYFTLGRFMLEENLRLCYRPDALVLSSEKISDSMRLVMEEAFGAPVFEEYGCVENCMLATECEEGSLHINEDFGLIEIVDESGNPVPQGEEGRILCTGLLNDVQPLIRYEVGDVGRLAMEPCPCGRNHLPVLEEVVGRLEDVVVGPDGRQMVRFHGIFIGIPSVVEGQIVQVSREKIIAKVVVADGFGPEQMTLIERRVKERLGSIDVQVVIVSEIERTERGKFRAVVSEIRDTEP